MTLPAAAHHTDRELQQVFAIERPHKNLMVYYGLVSLLFGPFFFIALVALYFRYHTMRYRFDAQGVNMRWGILFRREVSLAYARIQDIHLTSNILERWLGLAQVKVSTASGSVSAEMTVEGLQEFELVRDFLYTRMRGVQDRPAESHAPVAGDGAGSLAEVTSALHQVSQDLRAVRSALEALGTRARD